MYCTRADIEAKRLPRPYLVQLTDDEVIGEFDDSTGAVPPADNTLPLWSDSTSRINKRVSEAIEDAVNEIDAYLGSVYALPLLPEDVPAIINTIAVTISTYYLYVRRGNDIPDSVQTMYDAAVKVLRDIAARRVTLKLPPPTEGATETQSSFAVRSRTQIFNDDLMRMY
jgi:phage gp36-like protein